MLSNTPPNTPTEFELWVTHVYQELGARATHNVQILGEQIDVLVEENKADGIPIRTAIECKAFSVPLPLGEAIKAADHLLPLRNENKVNCVAICALNGFTARARLHCDERKVYCFTPQELIRHIADFDAYLDRVISSYSDTHVSRHNCFIPLTLESGNGTPLDEVASFLRKWIDSNAQLLTILGEYGSGKTTSLLHLAAQHASLCKANDRDARIPIVVELRALPSGTGLQSYLTDFFLRQHDFRIRSMAQVKRWTEEGKFIFFLDGFDEMFTRTDPIAVGKAMEEIVSLATGRNKILLSCRTSFFRDEHELGRLAPKKTLRWLLDQHDAEIVHVGAVTSTQIKTYLSAELGDSWEKWYLTINSNKYLSDLASRPILLYMLAQTIKAKRLKSLDALSVARLYIEYTEMWLERDSSRCRLSIDERREIAGALADQLLRAPEYRLAHMDLMSYLKSRFASRHWSEQEIGDAANEIRVCTFLKNRVDGYYSFVHRSFAEFLTAQHLLSKVSQKKFDVLLEQYTSDTTQFFFDLCALSPAVCNPELLQELLVDERWAGTRAQAIGLGVLAKLRADFSSLELRGLSLPTETDWSSMSLIAHRMPEMKAAKVRFAGTDFSRSVLTGSSFHECEFLNATLREVDMAKCEVSDCDLFGADMRGAVFDGTRFENTVLTPPDARSCAQQDLLESIQKIRRRLLQSGIDQLDVLNWNERAHNYQADLIVAARGDAKNIGHRIKQLTKDKEDQEADVNKRYSNGFVDTKKRVKRDKAIKQVRCRFQQRRIDLQLCRCEVQDLEALGMQLSKLTKDGRFSSMDARRRYSGASFIGCTGLNSDQLQWLRDAGAIVD